MEKKVLVAYSSKYGATREIAEKIATDLHREGLQVDVTPVKTVQDLAAYQAVILGSGVYIGQWNKEAAVFLQANEKVLAGRPVWIFSSGPTGEGDPVELVQGWLLPTSLKPVADRIHPRDIKVFHGYINPEKLMLIQRWMIKSVLKKPFGDFRDWKAISAWTAGIAGELKAA
jgi:menaquinone-dependent protoporphyrinogen oxidase